jgi:homoserine O-succinyltransferase
VETALATGATVPELPEVLIATQLDNTWHDSAEAVLNNWLGKVYQVTNSDRRLPFMEGVDPANPLDLP